MPHMGSAMPHMGSAMPHMGSAMPGMGNPMDRYIQLHVVIPGVEHPTDSGEERQSDLLAYEHLSNRSVDNLVDCS